MRKRWYDNVGLQLSNSWVNALRVKKEVNKHMRVLDSLAEG